MINKSQEPEAIIVIAALKANEVIKIQQEYKLKIMEEQFNRNMLLKTILYELFNKEVLEYANSDKRYISLQLDYYKSLHQINNLLCSGKNYYLQKNLFDTRTNTYICHTFNGYEFGYKNRDDPTPTNGVVYDASIDLSKTKDLKLIEFTNIINDLLDINDDYIFIDANKTPTLKVNLNFAIKSYIIVKDIQKCLIM